MSWGHPSVMALTRLNMDVFLFLAACQFSNRVPGIQDARRTELQLLKGNKIMSRTTFYAALTGVILTVGMAAEAPASRTFTQIDYPGAAVTTAFGVNSDRDVVGYYVDSTGNVHGFLLSGNQFSPIDYPGALITIARAINNKGDIVGSYQIDPTSPGGGNHRFYCMEESSRVWIFLVT